MSIVCVSWHSIWRSNNASFYCYYYNTPTRTNDQLFWCFPQQLSKVQLPKRPKNLQRLRKISSPALPSAWDARGGAVRSRGSFAEGTDKWGGAVCVSRVLDCRRYSPPVREFTIPPYAALRLGGDGIDSGSPT